MKYSMAIIISGTNYQNSKTCFQGCEHEHCEGLDADIHKLLKISITLDIFNEKVIAEYHAPVLPKQEEFHNACEKYPIIMSKVELINTLNIFSVQNF